MTYYVTIAERLDRGHTYADATIKETMTTCVGSDNAPERGPLGTYSEGGKTICYTAIGGYDTVAAARKAARKAIRDKGFRPGLMRDTDEYGFSDIVHFTIKGRS